MSVNKVILIGNLGRDPEVRTLQEDGKVVSLNVATSERWTDKRSGERREKTEWHRVTIWNEALAGVAERFLQKGSKVYLEGRLETRKWQDQSGQDRWSTEVVLRQFGAALVLLDGRGSEGGDAPSAPEEKGGAIKKPGGINSGPAQRPLGDLDDEIPF